MLNREPAATAWPEGVIARYLTVGGATVDVEDTGISPTMQGAVLDRSVSAACIGCVSSVGETTQRRWLEELPWPEPEVFDSALRELREASQAHAETCRAELNPNGQ